MTRRFAARGELRVPASRAETFRTGLLVLACLALLFFGLGDRALWDTDEGQHAATSRTMVTSGDWVVPQFNGAPFHDKPPLYNWLVALSFVVLGFTEFAARLPSAALGLGLVLLTYRFGREMLGATAAFLGALALLCCALTIALSRAVVHDICLAFLVGLALFAFYRAWSVEERRRTWLVLAYVCVGFSILAKGPLGGVLFGGVVLVFLALRRDLRFVLKMMPVRALLIAAAIALPWYLLLELREPGYLRYFLLEQNLGNFASADPRHPEPFWFYLPVLVLGFFPWSAFLPLTLWRLWQRRAELDPARQFLLVWAGFVFVFFSAASSKLPTYILPMLPAAALLVGDFWARLLEAPARRSQRGLVVSQLFVIAAVSYIVFGLWSEATGHKMYDPDVHRGHLVALSVLLVSTAMASSILLALKHYRGLFGANAAALAVLIGYLVLWLAPAIDPYRSTKTIGLRLHDQLPPGQNLTFFHEVKDSALFYTERLGTVLKTPEAVESFLLQDGALCVVDRSRLDRLDSIRESYRVVDQLANKAVIAGRGSTTAAPE